MCQQPLLGTYVPAWEKRTTRENNTKGRHPTCANERPSAARRLSNGMVYPLAFFQLEMHGGIFHACWSFTVTLRGGECMTGTGGDGGPAGTFLCLNLGGSKGSVGISTMRMMRCLAVVWPSALSLGVYWMYLSLAVDVEAVPGMVTGRAAAIFMFTIFSSAALVLDAVASSSSSEGRARESCAGKGKPTQDTTGKTTANIRHTC
jgi:hypothetical protein